MTAIREELPEWRGKYAGVDPFTKLHDGEPWFFQRAQDVTAPGGVDAYANTLNASSAIIHHFATQIEGEIAAELPPGVAEAMKPFIQKMRDKADDLHEQALDCFTAAEALRQFQIRNPTLVKLPD